MTNVPKGKAPRLGEIYAIPLGEDLFGFARFYLQGKFGIYDFVSTGLVRPKRLASQPIAFWVTCYEEPTRTGVWKRLGRISFASLDQAWPPPHYHRDSKDPLYFEIYDRNERRSASLADVAGLEPSKMWSESMIRERIQHQIVNRQPWDIKLHCGYCQDLAQLYGPNYEQVVAQKFREPSRHRSAHPPGTLIDAIDIDVYLKEMLSPRRSVPIVIEFMSEEAAQRRDEVDDLIDDLLADADLGGVVGSGSLNRPNPGDARCDLQLEVNNKRKALALIRRVLKQTGLLTTTRVILIDEI